MKPLFTHYCRIMPLAVVLLLGLISCAPRSFMVRQFAAMVEDGLPAIEQEADLQLLAKSMPAHIKLLETLLANDPDNEQLLILLSRLYGGYAFAVLETELEARRLDRPAVIDASLPGGYLETAVGRYFDTGAEYALRCLEIRHPGARAQLERLASAQAFIQSTHAEDAATLFWYAFNLGGFIQHNLDSVTAMAKAHLVEKAMRRVIVLNEGYYHGNAHLTLLVYYASRPAMMGGDPQQARAHYQGHAEMKGSTAGLRELFWARYMLTRQQAKAAFVQRLSAVPQTPAAGHSFSLLDAVAAVRARLYLETVDQFFD